MRHVKLIPWMLTLLLALGSTAQAQTACSGWRNPVTFNFPPSNNNEQYSGQTGTKPYTAGNCTTGVTGVTLNTSYTASQLATVTDAGSSSYCGSTLEGSKQFRIMRPGVSGEYQNDPLVGNNPALPVVPPASFGDFSSSVRLGNCQIDAHAEALYYDFDVTAENALFKLNYAIVAQAPGHGVTGDPAFWIRILRESSPGSNNFVPINANYCYIVSSTPTSGGGSVTIGQDGWHSYGGGYDQVYYRDWNQVAVSLYEYIYQRVRVEVIIGDCSASGHYAYAYIAGSCQPMALVAGGCASGERDTVTFITAPTNLDEYHWYRYPDGINPTPGDVDPNNYFEISGLNIHNNVLAVRSAYFAPRTNGGNPDSTLKQTTILCRMVSHMDPTHPFSSYLRTDIDNLKPTPSIDTIYACDNKVTIRDLSTAYTQLGGRGVDTLRTEWDFYNEPRFVPNIGMTPISHQIGPSATQEFALKGNHCVRMRTFNADSTSCYAEKVFQIRSITAPNPQIGFSKTTVCADSLVTITDLTRDTFGIGANQTILPSISHDWHIYSADGSGAIDTSFSTFNASFDIRLKDTVWVELTCHVNNAYTADTNSSGRRVKMFCDGTSRRKLFVEAPPTLKVLGDTIVCNGRTSIVTVEASLRNCTYKWYDGGLPGQGGTFLHDGATLTTQPTEDKTYFVEVRSENTCRSYDSIMISILKPTIAYTSPYGKPEICEGDTVKLWSSRATKYDWTGTPDDLSLLGQEHNDTVWCTPHSTTEYAVVGYGGSGDHECQADPMKQKIVVHPYPVLSIRLTPDYIDSDNPSVQFSDISDYGTSSLWDFGNGASSSTRSIVYTFSDLSQDSILIHLTSYNPLGCSRDTSFWVPVGIFTVWYPNAFTPRLETNSTFHAFTANELHDYELRVYDRSGRLVFFSVDPAEGWDGTHQGTECQQGAYTYIATYRRPGVERLLTQKGQVLLIK
ncbi:MAG: gliding motility-associated C-terminal domain-containing protein [Bacteroidales bacterium]|nr:gliding motility-associated C-terminal domain-containing protein [Bacteroidales bacterium]